MIAGFVGMGNMGSTMANLVAENGSAVIGWDHQANVVDEINERHTNSAYLPGVAIHPLVRGTKDLPEVFAASEIVFIAIPSLHITRTLALLAGNIDRRRIIVNLAKGIESSSGRTSFQVITELFPHNPCIMLSGPSIANEVAARQPTMVVIAGKDRTALGAVSRILNNAYFKTSTSDDERGVELGGILKNIYAIGLGIFDGKGIASVNFRSVYLTAALAEMAALGEALGARRETFFFLAGLGDLFATSLSSHSHNRRMGEMFARGMNFDQVAREMGSTPEGYNTLTVVLGLAKSRGVYLPIAEGLAGVIAGTLDVETFIYSVLEEERQCHESRPCR